ncbi:LLM class F420-dependent oxidoreductase [Pseudolysinimonas kribbensis]|uniref:LLM class F420-dependent oxidoreductase n=1 Tax=Pseudolysinimonas kribbensis TaxID=433641 RepID=A0ABQ6K8F1_9MICO|nr:TIGR03560 family F420-dependent LLM class oxidoreductase [Pseudolysinimonas kribbensis]GMA95031.1 LLM class F420-dependent oxidoreductase [Pseudolysinimonas kribbensis]
MEFCIFVEPQEGLTWEQLATIARETERLGFDGFFRSDHYIAPDRALRGAPAISDAWTTLAGLAVATERVRLGTLVTPVTFRHPGALAVQVANVDAMSGGRVELGFGAGWNAPEHAAYGIPFPGKRFGLLTEALEVMTGLWATAPGETFSFEGEHLRLDRALGVQRPVQDAIPLIIGGGGATRTPALTARFATEYNTGWEPDAVIAERFARVVAACEAADRDPETLGLSVALTATIGATPADADARARAIGLDPARQRTHGLHGTPAQVADRIADLAGLGAGRVYLQLLDPTDLEQLELLVEATQAAG